MIKSGITVLAIASDLVTSMDDDPLPDVDSSQYYDCKIVEEDSTLENDGAPVDFLRSNSSLAVRFDQADLNKLKYYQVGDKVYTGVDEHSNLRSVLITQLSPETIAAIIG